MFIPFLPHLLAVAGIAALLGLGAGPVLALSPAMLAAQYLAPLLLAVGIGHLPVRWLGPYRMNTLSRRRAVVLVAWLWLLALLPLPGALVRALGAFGPGEELAIMALMVNFWLCDALALYPYNPLERRTLRAQGQRLLDTLRLPLPIVVLVAAGLTLPALLDQAVLGRLAGEEGLLWLEPMVVLLAMLLAAALAIPVLIRVCWGLRPLASSSAEALVRDELSANGVSVARVLSWPEDLLGVSTAGVIGLLPRFRYLLMSNRLSQALTPDELRSVTAHESAHLRHRHLWFFLIAILSFVLLMQAAMTVLYWLGLVTNVSLPIWAYVVLEVVALLAFLRLGLGFLSRHFERQADGQALRRQGLQPFHNAILKVGLLNGIPPELNNWHHYGIAQRVAFLQQAEHSPDVLRRHDRKVGRIKLGLLALLVLGIAGQAAVSSSAATGFVTRRVLAQQAARIDTPTQADLPLLRFLAYTALQDGDGAQASHYFRMILQVTPEDPAAQNNLAWLLVTRDRATAGELQEGLQLARSAAGHSDSAYIWDTVAEAHYRLAQFDQAAEAARHALRLARNGQGLGEAPLDYYRNRAERFGRRASQA